MFDGTKLNGWDVFDSLADISQFFVDRVNKSVDMGRLRFAGNDDASAPVVFKISHHRLEPLFGEPRTSGGISKSRGNRLGEAADLGMRHRNTVIGLGSCDCRSALEYIKPVHAGRGSACLGRPACREFTRVTEAGRPPIEEVRIEGYDDVGSIKMMQGVNVSSEGRA